MMPSWAHREFRPRLRLRTMNIVRRPAGSPTPPPPPLPRPPLPGGADNLRFTSAGGPNRPEASESNVPRPGGDAQNPVDLTRPPKRQKTTDEGTASLPPNRLGPHPGPGAAPAGRDRRGSIEQAPTPEEGKARFDQWVTDQNINKAKLQESRAGGSRVMEDGTLSRIKLGKQHFTDKHIRAIRDAGLDPDKVLMDFKGPGVSEYYRTRNQKYTPTTFNASPVPEKPGDPASPGYHYAQAKVTYRHGGGAGNYPPKLEREFHENGGGSRGDFHKRTGKLRKLTVTENYILNMKNSDDPHMKEIGTRIHALGPGIGWHTQTPKEIAANPYGNSLSLPPKNTQAPPPAAAPAPAAAPGTPPRLQVDTSVGGAHPGGSLSPLDGNPFGDIYSASPRAPHLPVPQEPPPGSPPRAPDPTPGPASPGEGSRYGGTGLSPTGLSPAADWHDPFSGNVQTGTFNTPVGSLAPSASPPRSDVPPEAPSGPAQQGQVLSGPSMPQLVETPHMDTPGPYAALGNDVFMGASPSPSP